MKTSFLEYYKIILEKVSFDQSLFIKEYQKALKLIEQHEVKALDQWLKLSGYSTKPILVGQ